MVSSSETVTDQWDQHWRSISSLSKSEGQRRTENHQSINQYKYYGIWEMWSRLLFNMKLSGEHCEKCTVQVYERSVSAAPRVGHMTTSFNTHVTEKLWHSEAGLWWLIPTCECSLSSLLVCNMRSVCWYLLLSWQYSLKPLQGTSTQNKSSLWEL